MIPLWAIGGTFVILSILWVDNVSWALLEKVRQMSNADALTRIAMIEEGAPSSNAAKIFSAVSAKDNTATYRLDAVVNYPDLETIDENVADGRLMSPFSNTATAYKTAEVPFAEASKTIGVDKKITISTLDRSLKLIKPINIIVAVENTRDNRYNFTQAQQPLVNALSRLYNQAPSSRVSVVPYSFRVNYGGYCYTGINRGDKFDFSWWEKFLERYDDAILKEDALLAAQKALDDALKSIKENNEKLDEFKKELSGYDPGSEQHSNLSKEIKALEKVIKDLEQTIPQLEKDLEDAKEESEKQKDLMESLEDHQLYDTYRPLALHYARNYDNYKILEDYTDEFANNDGYRIDETNFLSSAVNINVIPQYLTKLAVKRNGPFSDADTCPPVSVISSLSNIRSVRSVFSSLTFSNEKIMSLEGVLWAGRLANTMNAPGLRNVIILFASAKDDVLDDNKLLGVGESCNAIKQSYYNRRSTKIVFVVKDRDAMEKFSRLDCATKLSGKPGFIIQDEIVDNFSEQMELNFMYLFSQESTSRDAN